MKKLIVAIMTIIMTVGLAACGNPTPSETVDSFLDGVKNTDADAVKSVYSGKSFNFDKDLSEFGGNDKELAKITKESLVPKLLDFDYEIGEEKIDGDKATVEVTFTTYNFGDALTSFMTDYIAQGMVMAFDDSSEKKLEKLAVTLYKKSIKDMKKDYTGKAKISLTKKDDTWMVDEIQDDDAFYNVFLGGAIDSMKDLEKTYGE